MHLYRQNRNYFHVWYQTVVNMKETSPCLEWTSHFLISRRNGPWGCLKKNLINNNTIILFWYGSSIGGARADSDQGKDFIPWGIYVFKDDNDGDDDNEVV